jgi:arsenate reductase
VNPAYPPGLLLITDRRQATHPLERIVAAALEAGFAAVMLREKDLDGGPLLALARPLAELCRAAKRPFLVNERLDVALALDRAGVHVGKEGFPVPLARSLLGPGRLLGYSAHEGEEAARALEEGADYATLGPVFPSRSKPGYEPRGLEVLQGTPGHLSTARIVALGGVENPERVSRVRATGVAGAAVMGAMMRARDPEATAASLVSAWWESSPASQGHRLQKVLFLCTGNSCRSQMAEGWARALRGADLEPYSAGVETHGMNERAVRAMAEANVDITGQRSKLVDELLDVPFDLVVTVCDRARESCPIFPGGVRVLHRSFEDPPLLARDAATEEEAMAHYRRVRDEIRAFVETLPIAPEEPPRNG